MRSMLIAVAAFGLCAWLVAQGTPPTPPVPSGGATYSSDTPPPTPEMTIEQRADLFIARRDYDAALDLLEQAVKEHKGTAPIYNRIGIANQQLEHLSTAARYYKLAIRADGHNGTFYNNLGTVYYEQHKYKQAVEQYHRAIICDPNQATFFVNLGSADFALKDYEPAMQSYRQALQLDPNALFPSDTSGTALLDLTRTDEPRYHYELSKLFCSMGQLDDAMHQFRQAMDLHYPGLKASLTDPAFAPLRARADFQALMNIPPPKSATGGRGAGSL